MPAANTMDKILARIEKTETCWLWTGGLDRAGYGRVDYRGARRSVHRLIYETLVGPIPEGLCLDHLCRVPKCCRPDHLEPVTYQVNTQRGRTSLDFGGKCRRGHDTTKPGAIIAEGIQRRCAVCASNWNHTFRVDEELWNDAKAEAASHGLSTSDVIEAGLRDYVLRLDLAADYAL